jgi:hypothetical protein
MQNNSVTTTTTSRSTEISRVAQPTMSEDQEAFSAELQQQEETAHRLAQTLARERSIRTTRSPPCDLERLPTEAVVGKAWADDVHAAAEAQDELSRTLESVGSCGGLRPDTTDLPPSNSNPANSISMALWNNSSSLRQVPQARTADDTPQPPCEVQMAGLERLPTEVVMGTQWAEDVHAAQAAQESLGQTLSKSNFSKLSADVTRSHDIVLTTPPVEADWAPGVEITRVPTEVVVGQEWADEVLAVSCAQELLCTTIDASTDDMSGGENTLADGSLPSGIENEPPLERLPTATVVGKQWAEDVNAARSAQAALACELSVDTKGALPLVSPGMLSIPSPCFCCWCVRAVEPSMYCLGA